MMDVISAFEFFQEDNICDDKMMEKIKMIDYQLFLNKMCDQRLDLSRMPFISYQMNFFNEKMISYSVENNGKKSVEVELIDNNFMLNIIHPDSIKKIVSESKNPYVFIPIDFFHIQNKIGHCTILIIDVKSKEVYFFDPNGESHYFDGLCDSMFENKLVDEYSYLIELGMIADYERMIAGKNTKYTWHFIQKLLKEYVKDIGLTFVNVKQIQLNREYKDESSSTKVIYGNENCVVLVFMVIHYMMMSGKKLGEIIKNFDCLSDINLITLINGYSCWILQNLIE